MSPSQHVQLHVQIHFTCEALHLPSNIHAPPRVSSRVGFHPRRAMIAWVVYSYTFQSPIVFDMICVAMSAVQYCEGQLTLLASIRTRVYQRYSVETSVSQKVEVVSIELQVFT